MYHVKNNPVEKESNFRLDDIYISKYDKRGNIL